jgi:transposase
MAKTRPPYPAEIRREAVRLLRAGDRSPRQLARELGCSDQTLRNWLRQERVDAGERPGLTTAERGSVAAA